MNVPAKFFSEYTNQELKDAIKKELDPVRKIELMVYAEWRKLEIRPYQGLLE